MAIVDADPADFLPEAKRAEQSSPDLKLIAEFLHSDRVITPRMRSWFANLFDQTGTGDWQVKVIDRRKNKGRPPASMLPHSDAVLRYLELCDQMKAEAALVQTLEEFPYITRSTLLNAVRIYRDALEEHNAIINAESEHLPRQR